MNAMSAVFGLLLLLFGLLPPGAEAAKPPPALIDASSLRGKVLCGYQGWFRCPGDDSGAGWRHWSRDGKKITQETVTVEMWPDMTEYTSAERYPADGFTNGDGSPAVLFSSVQPLTVRRHFHWMKQYGIDGVFVQRFVSELGGQAPPDTRVLRLVREAAQQTGRVFAVEYDMSGVPPQIAQARIQKDWAYLRDTLHLTEDPRYLHQDGKPALAVFGFFTDRFSGQEAQALIDSLHSPPAPVFLVGGCQWWWRTEKDPAWAKAFRSLDALKPWNVGNTAKAADGVTQASTGYWAEDLAEARRAGVMYLPVLYPGFSWDNLKRPPFGTSTISRRDGKFFQEQFQEAARLGITQAFVAMFDEVDEGTAIFKVTSAPPTPGHFVTLDGLPTDTYLRLTGDGTRMLQKAGP